MFIVLNICGDDPDIVHKCPTSSPQIKKASKNEIFDAFALDIFFIAKSKKSVNTLTENFFNDKLRFIDFIETFAKGQCLTPRPLPSFF